MTAQTLEEYKKRGACGKVFHGYLERRKTPPAIRDIPSNSKEWDFQEWNECNVNKDADRCKPIDFWLVPVVFFRQTTQDPCFDYSSLDTQAVESQSGNGSGIVDCHMDTDISDLDIE